MNSINELKQAIARQDLVGTLDLMNSISQDMRSDNVLLKEFLAPATISELHQLLTANFDVHPRMMQVRKRVPTARPRAQLFLQAMRIALEKTTK